MKTIYIVTAVNSDDDLIFQQVYNKKCEARSEFNHQVRDSKENFIDFGTYEYTLEESSDFKVVQASNCHTTVYLREFEIE